MNKLVPKTGLLKNNKKEKEKLFFKTEETNNIVTNNDNIFISESIYFNPINQSYVIYLKSAGRNVVVSEKTLKSIFLSYSEIFGEPSTIEDVMRILNWPRSCVEELLKLFGTNHKSLPVTPMELKNKGDDEILDDIELHRKFLLQQKLEHKTWHLIQANSLKWEAFEKDLFFPIENVIKNWKPLKTSSLKKHDYNYNEDILVVSLNDIHCGALARGEKLFSGRNYNTEISLKGIEDYLCQIRDRLYNRVEKPRKCFVLINGDLLHSFADSMTRRGTLLSSDIINEELFKVGLDLIFDFISKISSLFYETEISFGKGNHESIVSLYLGIAAQKIFSDRKDIKINVEEKYIFSNWINNVYMLASHGAHDTMKGITIPRSGNKLQIFVQNHLLEKAAEISKAGQKILLLGHYHSLYSEDFGAFTVYRFGSSVKGDAHGEALGYFNKAYQNCLLVGKNEVKELWNIYL